MPTLSKTCGILVVCILSATGSPAASPDAEIAAEAVRIKVNPDGSATETGARSIHILTEAGLAYTTMSLVVTPTTELTSIQGVTKLPDGRELKLLPHHVVQQPMLNSAVINDIQIVQAAFPLAVVGSTVRLSWARKVGSLVYLEPWVFRGHLPIRQSRFEVSVPEGVPFRYHAWNGNIEPKTTTEDGFTTHTFETSAAPAFEHEPLAPPFSEQAGLVRIAVVTPGASRAGISELSWRGVASLYDRLAEGRYQLDPEVASEVRALAKSTRDQRELAAQLYQRLRRFRYEQVYLDIGGYQPHAAMWTWKRRYGDCKDLATVYIAMARAAGLEAHPMLTRIGGHGSYVEDFPSVLQFNHCVASVRLPEGEVIVDATAPDYPFGMLPAPLAGAPGLVVEGKGKFRQLTLPGYDPARNRLDTELQLELSESGFTGLLTSTLTGDFLSSGRDLARMGEQDLSGGKLRSVAAISTIAARVREPVYHDENGQLRVSGKFESAVPIPRASGHLLIAPVLFYRDPRLRAFASATRQQPIDLGLAAETVLRARIQISGTATLPETFERDSRFGHYKTSFATQDGQLTVERSLLVKLAWIEPADYVEARAFWAEVARGDQLSAEIETKP